MVFSRITIGLTSADSRDAPQFSLDETWIVWFSLARPLMVRISRTREVIEIWTLITRLNEARCPDAITPAIISVVVLSLQGESGGALAHVANEGLE
jgi:hypothetical protein